MTTRARTLRRENERVTLSAIDVMLDVYNQDPNQALRLCFKWFGKDKFQQVLKMYIHRNLIKMSFVKAVQKCMSLQKENQHV